MMMMMMMVMMMMMMMNKKKIVDDKIYKFSLIKGKPQKRNCMHDLLL